MNNLCGCSGEFDKYLPPLILIDSEGVISGFSPAASEYYPEIKKDLRIFDLTGLNGSLELKPGESVIAVDSKGKKNEIIFSKCENGLIIARIRRISDIFDAELYVNEKIAEAAEAMPVGIFEFDMNGVFLYANGYLCGLCGYERSEVIGKMNVIDVLIPELQDVFVSGLAQMIHSGDRKSREYILIKKNGEHFPVEVHASLKIYDGKPAGVMGIIVDLTDKKKAEEELLKTNRIQSLSVVAGGVAHDFNNILTVIIGNISLAKFDVDETSETYKLLSEAESASIKAKTLTNQLSAFTKESEPLREITNIEEMVRQSSIFVLSGSKSSCVFDFSDDLWRADIDCGQFSRVVQNIVLNASQSMPGGGTIVIKGRNIRVTIDDNLPVKFGKYILLTVEDNGCGIPKENLARIFDPYYTTKETGTGLGLSVSFSVVKNHGGYIRVQSNLGKGTLVEVYIPAVSAKYQIECPDEPSGGIPDHLKILIIDDDESIGKVTVELLRILGHSVTYSSSAEKAIELYSLAFSNSDPFDMVIIDLTMPGNIPSCDLLNEFRKIKCVKAVVSSGFINNEIMTNFKDYGFDYSIRKPFTIDELRRCISELY